MLLGVYTSLRRLQVLRVALILIGLFFVAGLHPLVMSIREGWHMNREDAEPMGISLYVMQGVFLLLVARDPEAIVG